MLAVSLSVKKETFIIITVATQEKEVLGRDLLTDPRGSLIYLLFTFVRSFRGYASTVTVMRGPHNAMIAARL